MSTADTRARAALAARFRDAADLIDAVSAMDAVGHASTVNGHAVNGKGTVNGAVNGAAGLEVKSRAAEASTTSRRRGRPANHEKARPAITRAGNDVAVPPAIVPGRGPASSEARPGLKLRKGEAGKLIRDYLRRNPKARAVDAARELGVSAGHVSATRLAMREAGELGNSDGSKVGDGDDAEPAEKAKPPPLVDRPIRSEKRREIIREARAAVKSGALMRDIFGDGPKSLVASALYALPCEEVDDKAREVHETIQVAIYSRAEKLRERWTGAHERKANNYFLPPLAYDRLSAFTGMPIVDFKERFE